VLTRIIISYILIVRFLPGIVPHRDRPFAGMTTKDKGMTIKEKPL
jgi:hypothetical protein